VCELEANKAVRVNADHFTSHKLPQTVVGTSHNGVNISLKVSGEVSRAKDALGSSSSKKTPEPALFSNNTV
jgi:hypothetical protein